MVFLEKYRKTQKYERESQYASPEQTNIRTRNEPKNNCKTDEKKVAKFYGQFINPLGAQRFQLTYRR